MNKKGFAAMYMVYSLFLIFILMMLTVLLINNYKASFLNALKNDIKTLITLLKYQEFRIVQLEKQIKKM